MGSLERLARNRFADLSAAEEKIVRGAPEGDVADCKDLGGDDYLQNFDGTPKPLGEGWPEMRNVRAELIRWLCTDREARELVDPKGVRIQSARIVGDLNLSFANFSFPLVLLCCRLEQDLLLTGAKIPAVG
jgi:hypothetical protein